MSTNEFQTVSDEMLMSYVDGELDDETAAAVGAAIARDPALADLAAMFRQTRADSLAAFADILAERPPEHLVEAVSRASVETDHGRADRSLRMRRGSRPGVRSHGVARRPMPSWGLPLAACLMVAAGFGGYLAADLRPDAAPHGLLAFGSDETLAAAFSSQPSGEAVRLGGSPGPADLTLLGTYEVADGLCRVFALSGTDGAGTVRGLACRAGGPEWQVEVALRESGAGEAAFSPASDRVAAVIDDQLDAQGAGSPLGREAEARALARIDAQ